MRTPFLYLVALITVGCSSTEAEPGKGGSPPEQPPGTETPGEIPDGEAPAPTADEITVSGTFTAVPLDAIWDLSSVAVVGPKEVYAVATGNGKTQIFSYDGTAWTDAIADATSPRMSTVAGAPWLYGGGLATKTKSGWNDHWSAVDQTHVNAVWGSATSDVYAVGAKGTYHFDGAQWERKTDAAIASIEFDSIWGSSADDVWFSQYTSGSRGQLFHFDGKAWTDVWSSLPKSLRDNYYSLYDVSGSSRDNVWALSRGGSVLVHYDGTTWTEAGPPGAGWGCTLSTVWTSGKKNAWLAGTDGCIHHWDGTAWSKVASGTTKNLYHLSGSSAEEVWLVTEGKELLHLVPEKK